MYGYTTFKTKYTNKLFETVTSSIDNPNYQTSIQKPSRKIVKSCLKTLDDNYLNNEETNSDKSILGSSYCNLSSSSIKKSINIKKLLDFDDDLININNNDNIELKSSLINSNHNNSFDSITSKNYSELTSCETDLNDNILPNFSHEYTQLDLPLELEGNENVPKKYLNRYAFRRLMDHQVIGLKWLWSKYINRQGCILGDSMGMGKTIQVISLLLVIYNKSGNKTIDRNTIKRYNNDYKINQASYNLIVEQNNCYLPSLIVAPASVLDNWIREINTWGKFNVLILKSYDCLDDYISLTEYIYSNKIEILVLSYHMLEKFIHFLCNIKWEIIVYDEGHELRNIKTKKYSDVLALQYAHMRIICTGTPIQNNTDDLWALINIITNQTFMNRNDFIEFYTKPILRFMSKNAEELDEKIGKKKLDDLNINVINKYIIQRNKDLLLDLNLLKGKEDIVILCNLSLLQHKLYQTLLDLPDYILLKSFMENKNKFGKMNMNPLMKIPLDDNGNINKKAIIWREFHSDNSPCKHCPSCILFPCITKLSQVANHPMLLQCHNGMNDDDYYKCKQFLSKCLPIDILNELNGICKNETFNITTYIENSGKMIVLDKLLMNLINYNKFKVLIFTSQNSIQMLNILETYIKYKKWLYRRLDGSTPTDKRQQLIDEFNNDPDINIFIISSKAGGLGINLKSASKVIIFDTNWNPAIDQQSQDRAYRIGQMNKVTVYRLVAKGTVEEMRYMRQIYKQEISSTVLDKNSKAFDDIVTTIKNDSSSIQNNNSKVNQVGKKFVAIMGEVKGELFGIENILQYNNQSILKLLRQKYSSNDECNDNITTSNNDEGMDMDTIKTDDIIDSINQYIANNQTTTNSNIDEKVVNNTKVNPNKESKQIRKSKINLLQESNEITNEAVDIKYKDKPGDNNEIVEKSNENVSSSISEVPNNQLDKKKRKLPFDSSKSSTFITLVKPKYI